MSRKNIKCNGLTYEALLESKRESETWDDFLHRLAQLERATRIEEEQIDERTVKELAENYALPEEYVRANAAEIMEAARNEE